MIVADEPTREQLIEQLQQEQGARLNQIASADPVINRIAGKLDTASIKRRGTGIKSG